MARSMRMMVYGGVRGLHRPTPLQNIVQSLDGGALAAGASQGPVSGMPIQGNGGRGLKVGMLITAVFIMLVLFLGLCQKAEQINDFLTHKHAKVGPVPEGVEFGDLEPAPRAAAGSAAQNPVVGQA